MLVSGPNISDTGNTSGTMPICILPHTRQKIWLPGNRVDIAMCILERISEAGLFLEAERRETVAGNASLRSSCHYNSPILDYLRSKHLHAFCLVLPRNTAVNFPYQDPMSVISALLIVLIALSPCPEAILRLPTGCQPQNLIILFQISTDTSSTQKQTLMHMYPDRCRRREYPLSERPLTVWTSRWLISCPSARFSRLS